MEVWEEVTWRACLLVSCTLYHALPPTEQCGTHMEEGSNAGGELPMCPPRPLFPNSKIPGVYEIEPNAKHGENLWALYVSFQIRTTVGVGGIPEAEAPSALPAGAGGTHGSCLRVDGGEAAGFDLTDWKQEGKKSAALLEGNSGSPVYSLVGAKCPQDKCSLWRAPRQATWEAEAGELLEPGRRRLQRAEIVPLHSSLATQRDSISKKKKKKKKKERKRERTLSSSNQTRPEEQNNSSFPASARPTCLYLMTKLLIPPCGGFQALKMMAVDGNKRLMVDLEARKGHQADCPLELPEGNAALLAEPSESHVRLLTSRA
ncbi:hypothetical protein AAY473_007788, partial [Plecturocebus cupreus]